MGHLYHGYVSHNQTVNFPLNSSTHPPAAVPHHIAHFHLSLSGQRFYLATLQLTIGTSHDIFLF